MTRTVRHPPEHVLAEFADEALDPGRTSEVQAHVAGCEHCQAVLNRLAQISQALQAVPSRLPTPVDVSARISAALALEATAVPERRTEDATPGDIRQGPVAWFRRRVPQALAAAAAAAAIGVLGYSLVAGGDSPIDFAGGGADEDTAAESADDSELTAARDQEASEESASGGAAPFDQHGADSDDAPNRADDGAAANLDQAVVDVWRENEEVEPQCGRLLADDRGLDLAGSTPFADGVLVVVIDGTELHGWVLPNCATVPEGGDPDVVVPVPTE